MKLITHNQGAAGIFCCSIYLQVASHRFDSAVCSRPSALYLAVGQIPLPAADSKIS